MPEKNITDETFNPLLMPILSAMELAFNQLLAMDPETKNRLTGFSGKIIAFHLTDLNQTFYLFPDQQGLLILGHYDGEPDTQISGSFLAFARMGMADEKVKTASVFNGDIKITGDIGLGQHFQALLQQLDIDWEEHLSHLTGDVIAHSIGNLSRSILGWGRQTATTLGLNSSEYIQYETRDIASGPEVNSFNKQVDILRSDVDRAEARFARLMQHINKKKMQ